MLIHTKKLNIKGVSGDLLFSQEDLQKVTINGEDLYSTNTTYTPTNSDLAKEIQQQN